MSVSIVSSRQFEDDVRLMFDNCIKIQIMLEELGSGTGMKLRDRERCSREASFLRHEICLPERRAQTTSFDR